MIYYVIKDITTGLYMKRIGETFTKELRNANLYTLNELNVALNIELNAKDNSLKVIPIKMEETNEE